MSCSSGDSLKNKNKRYTLQYLNKLDSKMRMFSHLKYNQIT